MASDSIVHRLLEQVEGSHYTLIRFVGKICRHEWDWAPDDGIRGAADVVANLVREEHKILAKSRGTLRGGADKTVFASPAAAAAALRTLREATCTELLRMAEAGDGALAAVQLAVSLAQLDAHALGELGLLQRLIDPARTPTSPR